MILPSVKVYKQPILSISLLFSRRISSMFVIIYVLYEKFCLLSKKTKRYMKQFDLVDTSYIGRNI